MTTEQRTQLLNKIEKLLALSTSPNENEAASALAKAQQLLMEHNLSVADITPAKKQDVTEADLMEDAEGTWVVYLRTPLASLFDCRTYRHTRGKLYTAKVIGHPQNIETFSLLFNWLIPTIEQLSMLAVPTYLKGRKAQEFFDSFCKGAAARIVQRISEQKKLQQEQSACKALVVLFKEQVDEYFDSLQLSGGGKTHKQMNSSAYFAGQRAANSIILDPQLQ